MLHSILVPKIRLNVDPRPHQRHSPHMLHLRRATTPKDQDNPASQPVDTSSSSIVGMDPSIHVDGITADPSALSRIHARGRAGKDHSPSTPKPTSSSVEGQPHSTSTSWWSSIRVMGLEPSPELLAIALVYFVQGILGLSRLALQFFFKGEVFSFLSQAHSSCSDPTLDLSGSSNVALSPPVLEIEVHCSLRPHRRALLPQAS